MQAKHGVLECMVFIDVPSDGGAQAEKIKAILKPMSVCG